MVTTRSAEKRVAVAGKTEDLAVRTRASDILASPTPSQATTMKKQRISVDVPPPLEKRKRLSNSALDTNRDSGGDDDSPYATAKESPESFRDTETHFLSSATKAASSPTTVRNEPESPTKVEHSRNSVDAEASNQGIAKLSGTLQESRDLKTSPAHVPYTPIAGNGVHKRFEGDDLPEQLYVEEKTRPTASSSSENEDEAPEIISSKQARPTNMSTKKRIMAKQIPTAAATQTSKRAGTDDSHDMINEVQIPQDPKKSQALGVKGEPETLPTPLSDVQTNQKSSTPDSTTTTTDSHNFRPTSQSLVNHSFPHQSFQKGNLVPLPAKMSRSLESYRRSQLVNRAVKRSSGFHLTDNWDKKRRKFVIAN